ncbi:MAG: LysR substrate-binding domain-containing protein, partial [Pseudomonadota bacterium]
FQIKSLEEHLGEPVFRRLNRAVELTEAGKILAPGTTEGFTTLMSAWRAVRRATDQSHLTVTAGPAFTAKWLAPRLYQFAQAHPDIELRFSASLRFMDFARDDVDVAIRFGYGPDPGLYALPLRDEWVTPVMTPELAQQCQTVDALQNQTLIVDHSLDFLDPKCDWYTWFTTMGYDTPEIHGPQFSQSDHAVDAALAGVGVVLGRRSMVVKDLAEGRLVAPFATALNTGARFRFLCAEGYENRPAIRAFRDWIVSEIDDLEHITDGLDIRTP